MGQNFQDGGPPLPLTRGSRCRRPAPLGTYSGMQHKQHLPQSQGSLVVPEQWPPRRPCPSPGTCAHVTCRDKRDAAGVIKGKDFAAGGYPASPRPSTSHEYMKSESLSWLWSEGAVTMGDSREKGCCWL